VIRFRARLYWLRVKLNVASLILPGGSPAFWKLRDEAAGIVADGEELLRRV